mmetsp:Transcript_18280/g.47790  ORF Transcript_18280/g.47790 Transcript_18280/m.47790 type:complete len:220 (-) Transcript_18280:170-829(-)
MTAAAAAAAAAAPSGPLAPATSVPVSLTHAPLTAGFPFIFGPVRYISGLRLCSSVDPLSSSYSTLRVYALRCRRTDARSTELRTFTVHGNHAPDLLPVPSSSQYTATRSSTTTSVKCGSNGDLVVACNKVTKPAFCGGASMSSAGTAAAKSTGAGRTKTHASPASTSVPYMSSVSSASCSVLSTLQCSAQVFGLFRGPPRGDAAHKPPGACSSSSPSIT